MSAVQDQVVGMLRAKPEPTALAGQRIETGAAGGRIGNFVHRSCFSKFGGLGKRWREQNGAEDG